MNLEPTPAGYVSIASMFRQSLTVGMTPEKIQMLRSLIEVAVYLAANHPDEYHQLMNPLSSGK